MIGKGARALKTPAHILERKRRYYQKNKRVLIAKATAWKRANKDRVNRVQQEWIDANPERAREIRKRATRNQRLRKFGLTLEQYEAMLKAQGFACAVCRSPDSGTKHDWHIDHDHRTGKVRGLLCHHCNAALGFSRDNPDVLRQLIAYLEGRTNGTSGNF